MSMQDDNPFKAPSARVSDFNPGSSAGTLDLDGIRQPAGAGVDWIKGGWALFKQAPGPWIGIFLVFMVIVIVLSLIPVVSLVVNLLMPVFMGGMMLGCKAQEDGETLTVGHLFAGFQKNAGSLVVVGLLYLAGVLVIGLVFGVGIAMTMGFSNGGFNPMIIVLGLLAGLCIIPLVMAFWFATPLVAIHNVPALAAMKASFFASLRNWLPLLVYGLVAMLVVIVAMIPLGLGLLVASPALYASMYVAYKSMFLRNDA